LLGFQDRLETHQESGISKEGREMWKVLPKLGLLKFLFSAFSALFIAFLILLLEPSAEGNSLLSWSNFGSAIKLATPVTIIFIAVVFFFGKKGWIWLWKLPLLGEILNRCVCPNLNGVWEGTIESNFEDGDGNRVKKDIELEIKADLFGFSISQKSLDGYQDSKVVQSDIYRDPRTGVFYLSYIFEGVVPIPLETDDRLFDGAGKMEVKLSDNSIQLLGTYWTNRAWQRKQNTAGIISVRRNGS